MNKPLPGSPPAQAQAGVARPAQAPVSAPPQAAQAALPANVIELQTRMKMMELQQQAQLKLVEQTVTEILIQIKQKSQSIDQDVMRIKKILDSLNVKK
jgi:phosphoribosyl-dephospho-CoA transferase